MRRRRLWMVLLGLGAVAGFGSELGRCHARHWADRRAAMMGAWDRPCMDAPRMRAP